MTLDEFFSSLEAASRYWKFYLNSDGEIRAEAGNGRDPYCPMQVVARFEGYSPHPPDDTEELSEILDLPRMVAEEIAAEADNLPVFMSRIQCRLLKACRIFL